MSNPKRIVLVVNLEVNGTHFDNYLEQIKLHAHNSVQLERNCLRFEVLVTDESQINIILVEVYEHHEALQTHANSEHMAKYRTLTEGMVAKSTIHRCSAAYP